MVIHNPYRELVLNDENIITDTEIIYKNRGTWNQYFGNKNPLILEIGTGMGNFFSKQVSENPDKNFIGMEIRYKRLFQTAEKSRKYKDSHTENNFVVLKDFGQHIDQIFMPNEISESYVFFPDPWGKKENQKKNRLLLKDFLENLYNITKPSGKLFFKSDHREYFDSTLEIITQQGLWNIEKWTHNYENDEIFDMGNITEFEALYRGEKIHINYVELSK